MLNVLNAIRNRYYSIVTNARFKGFDTVLKYATDLYFATVQQQLVHEPASEILNKLARRPLCTRIAFKR